jgi:hypothetical protein
MGRINFRLGMKRYTLSVVIVKEYDVTILQSIFSS